MCVSVWTHWYQSGNVEVRRKSGSQSSPSTMWVPKVETQVIGHLNPLSPLAGTHALRFTVLTCLWSCHHQLLCLWDPRSDTLTSTCMPPPPPTRCVFQRGQIRNLIDQRVTWTKPSDFFLVNAEVVLTDYFMWICMWFAYICMLSPKSSHWVHRTENYPVKDALPEALISYDTLYVFIWHPEAAENTMLPW